MVYSQGCRREAMELPSIPGSAHVVSPYVVPAHPGHRRDRGRALDHLHPARRATPMRAMSLRLLVLMSLAVLIAGPTLAGAQTPKRGGTVRMVEPGEPDSLDMARTLANYSFIVGEQIFEGLFRWTPKGLVPWLAQDVRVSADGKSWTLRLRQGVTFHDGTPFNAEAVKFNLERIRDGKGFAYSGLLAPLAEIKAADEHTVQITMKAPYGPFRALLGFIYFGMQSPTALQKHGENSGSKPVGTGPYKFQYWQRGDELTLVGT